MESKEDEFCLTGVIKGKDMKLLKDYMKSSVNSIKSEIKEITKKNKNINVYYRYNSEKFILNIFFTITIKDKNNIKNNDITYLITLGEEYPKIPPMVFCLTDFYEKLDIFDMRNIQKDLVHDWKPNNKINDLLNDLLYFHDTLINQSEKKLFPNTGEYIYNKYIYNLNDFFLNKNNAFFRVYYLKKKEITDIDERYMIVTKSKILFLSNHDQKLKNKCVLEYKFELTWLESLNCYSLSDYPKYYFFEFKWNNHSSYLRKFIFATKFDKEANNKLHDIIVDRRKFLLDNFVYFEKYNDNDVKTLEKIIEIKIKCLEKKYSKNLFYQVHKLYKSIINIYNSMNDEGYKLYIDKMQHFFSKFKNI